MKPSTLDERFSVYGGISQNFVPMSGKIRGLAIIQQWEISEVLLIMKCNGKHSNDLELLLH